ncbi:hypothetical protein Zmor_020247 [Zophobas morio]|uniref:Insulin gene enhancer protein ISL-1 n=2 Tax=Tenebrionidae TaxID=7065 RepID=A0AA38M9I4_9CUCU|nr:hypothetical protein Zmor_020247 [Zophobas morio]
MQIRKSLMSTTLAPECYCVGCGGQIHDQYILRVAPDLEWHAACLKCQECHQFLDENCTCFVRDGKTYCKRDYVRLFGTKCDRCGSAFSKEDFVMRAKSKIYHIKCFICCACSRPLKPGDEFALRDGGDLYCKQDHDHMEKTSVPTPPHLPSAESNNNTSLSNNNHSSNSMELGCMLFGTKCDRCGSAFSKEDFVMRAKSKIYHIKCFICCACSRPLKPGDEFALRDGGDLYCKQDHDHMEKTSVPTPPHLPSAESNNNTSLSNNNHSSNSMELGCMSDSGSESGSHKGGGGGLRKGSGGGGGGGSDGKPTRVRTVLNEKQLHTLRTCYAANPRPDALMKEQLVEMTGLSPRVIRVWFQNKRCKDKKKTILMKQQMQQEKYYVQDGRKLGYGAMQGIPMVASSPVRHDSPIGVLPLEVQAYQPPWKALSDFALHADLEQPHQPAFQQLVNQMHGYDLPPPSMGPATGPPPGMLPSSAPPSDVMTHPDSTDSYVTYLESDESLPASP